MVPEIWFNPFTTNPLYTSTTCIQGVQDTELFVARTAADNKKVTITCLQGVGALVSACTQLTVLKFKLVQIIFFASIVYTLCLGKYFGREGVKWRKSFAVVIRCDRVELASHQTSVQLQSAAMG